MIDAIMLLAFGGPESMAEVRPFLSQVAAGVGIPESRLEEVALHYEHFDGFSPLNEQNRRLAKALSEALSARGHDLPVVLGNRNGKDRINETLGTLESEGKKLVLAVPTTPFASYSSCRQYMENVAAALEGMEISAVKMPPYIGIDGLVEANARLLAEVLEEKMEPSQPCLLFTTHSIPTAGSEVYVRQHLELADQIATRTSELLACSPLSWELVYQSRSGSPHTPWLEPDICDALRDKHAEGVKEVIVDPIGFLSDHMEVIWDLDNEAKSTAAELGMCFTRVPTVGVHPSFVNSLADLLAKYLSQDLRLPEPGEFCSTECCPSLNPRHASENRKTINGVTL